MPAAPGVTGQPVRLAPRPPLLAGREELLAELDARLTAAMVPGRGRSPCAGLGGAGKTSVALEYAHRHLAEVGVAWQFAAEDATVLADGFGSWPPSSAPGMSLMPGTRWRRCTGCSPRSRRSGC